MIVFKAISRPHLYVPVCGTHDTSTTIYFACHTSLRRVQSFRHWPRQCHFPWSRSTFWPHDLSLEWSAGRKPNPNIMAIPLLRYLQHKNINNELFGYKFPQNQIPTLWGGWKRFCILAHFAIFFENCLQMALKILYHEKIQNAPRSLPLCRFWKPLFGFPWRPPDPR